MITTFSNELQCVLSLLSVSHLSSFFDQEDEAIDELVVVVGTFTLFFVPCVKDQLSI